MKSTAFKKRPIRFGEVIRMTELFASEGQVESLRSDIKNREPELSSKDVEKQLQDVIMTENYFNSMMDFLVSHYEFNIDDAELSKGIERVSRMNPSADNGYAERIARVRIIKRMVFDDLAKDWELSASDQFVKDSLQNFYKKTGEPIREFLMNPERFEEVRVDLVDRMVNNRLLNAFKAEFVLDKQQKEEPVEKTEQAKS